MPLSQDLFEDDFLPPPSLMKGSKARKKRDGKILPVDEEISRSFSRMGLQYPMSNRVPFIPHSAFIDPEIVLAALEDPDKLDDLPEDEDICPCSMVEDTGEIRISALRGDSRETPFATQDLDVADEDDIPGLLPESGFQVFASCHEMGERDRKFLDADRLRVERRCCREGVKLSREADED